MKTEKIACSRGHSYDLNTSRGVWESKGKRAGDRCPMVMSYDRMFGNCYCQRILKPVDDKGNITIRGKEIKI